MPDAKQRRATVSGGSPTFERNSLMVDDPVIRPKTQAVNRAPRDAPLAVLAASENNLQGRGGGEEEGGRRRGDLVWRKTSSESSSGQKGPSESEMEDSVFSSDKEDKDQQTPKKPTPSAERDQQQEFRVTKPTPILLEPAPDPHPPSRSPVRRTSSSSSVSSTTSSSTLINSPHTAPKLHAVTVTAPNLKVPETSIPVPKSGTQTHTLDTAPHTPVSPPAVLTRKSSSSKSPSSKRSFTSMFSRDSRKASAKGKAGGDSSKKSGSSSDKGKKTARTDADNGKNTGAAVGESEKKTGVFSDGGKKPSVFSDCSKKTSAFSDCSKKTGSVTEKEKKIAAVTDTGKKTAPVGENGKRTCTVIDGGKTLNGSEHSPPSGDAAMSGSVSAPSCQCPADTGHTCEDRVMATDTSQHNTVSDSPVTSTPQSQGEVTSAHQAEVCVSEDSEDQRSLSVHSELAGDMEGSDTPHLLKVTKIRSSAVMDTPSSAKISGDGPKSKKQVAFSPQTKEASSSEDVSYTQVVQKIPVEKCPSGSTESVRMRQKSGRGRPDRRVSCKDLGQGDCEGWLYKRKEKDRALSRQWHKRYCVLKSYNLYCYKNKEELKAEGVIYMPAFKVSPAPGLKTKKFAFKVHNPGTTFYFASERQDDMSKWMNKMGLAAISFDTSTVTTTGGFVRPEPRCQLLEVPNMDYSDSDDDPEEGQPAMSETTTTTTTPPTTATTTTTTTPPTSTPTTTTSTTVTPSPPGVSAKSSDPKVPGGAGGGGQEVVKENGGDELKTVLRAIHSQDLTIDGVDRRKRRTRHLSSMMGTPDGKTDPNIMKLRKLLALKRTLKVKEQELQDIDRLLASQPTASRLRDFIYRHPDIKL